MASYSNETTQVSNKTSPSNMGTGNSMPSNNAFPSLITENGHEFIYFEDFDTNGDGEINGDDAYNLAMGGFGQASNYALQINAGARPMPPLSNQQNHQSAATDTGITLQEAIGGSSITLEEVERVTGLQSNVIQPTITEKGLGTIETNGGTGFKGIDFTKYTESVLDRVSVLLIENFTKIQTEFKTIEDFQKTIRDGELVVNRKSNEKLVLYKQDITANKDDERLVEKIVNALGGIDPQSIEMKFRDGIGIFLQVPKMSPPGQEVQFNEIDISGLRVQSNLKGIFIEDNVGQFLSITPSKLEFDIDKTKEHLSTEFAELLPSSVSTSQRIAKWFGDWEQLREYISPGEVAKLGPNTLKFLDENPETLSYLIKSATDLVYRDVMPAYTRQQWDALTQDYDLSSAQVDILNASLETNRQQYESQIASLTEQINTLIEQVIPTLTEEYGVQEKISTAFLNTLLQAIRRGTEPIDMVNEIPFAETWDDFTQVDDNDFWFNSDVVVSTVEGPAQFGDSQAIRIERANSRPKYSWPGALVAGKKSTDEELDADLGKIFLKADRQYRMTVTAKAGTEDGFAKVFIGDTRGGWRGKGYSWGKTQTWQCGQEWTTYSTIFTPTTNPRHTWGDIANVGDSSKPEYQKSYEELGYENHDPDGDGEINWRDVGGPYEAVMAHIYIYAGTEDGAEPGQYVDYGDIVIEEIGADENIPAGVELGVMDMLSDPDYYEDYDINSDGDINVLDAQLWTQGGRPDIAQQIVQIIMGQKLVPKKNPFYMEDFDIHTNDGIFDVRDAQIWANEPFNRPDISEQIVEVILGNRLEPPRKTPIYFEDFDLNQDGVLSVLDITSWNQINRQDVSQQIVNFVTNNDFPIYRNPQFFEEYDISKDGNLTVVDIQMWINNGRPDVAETIQKFITGEFDMPIRKNPIYFEDFDRNMDGSIDVLDSVSWGDIPNLTESQKESAMRKTSDIILGLAPTPLHKNPIWFHDYDVNGDGMIDVRDSVIWLDQGRPGIADRIAKFITGEIPFPPVRY